MVPRRGLEPPRLAALVPETSASTNYAIWADGRARCLGGRPLTVNEAREEEKREAAAGCARFGRGFKRLRPPQLACREGVNPRRQASLARPSFRTTHSAPVFVSSDLMTARRCFVFV